MEIFSFGLDPYASCLSHLFSRAKSGMRLGLSGTTKLLEQLKNPHSNYPCIVVAGTNGKGSTSTLIASCLQKAGHRVGLYTSPHLMRFTERIRLSGTEISQPKVIHYYKQIQQAEQNLEQKSSFFECTTAMAFLAFADAGVDIAVLEVGIGGRLDATNIVKKKLSVITPIDFDHEEILGHTIDAIACEKAGIIDEEGTVVVATQKHSEALAVIERHAASQHAVVVHAPVTTYEQKNLVLRGQSITTQMQFKNFPAGEFQRANVATAVAACRQLHGMGISCPAQAIYDGVQSTLVQGRYQWLQENGPILLDVAHNVDGLQALVRGIKYDERCADKPIYTVFGSLRPTILQQQVEILRTVSKAFFMAPLPSPRSALPKDLAQACPRAKLFSTPLAAFRMAAMAASEHKGIVLVTGSFRVVGPVLATLLKESLDPFVDG